ncbi:MAG: DUF58 domain-containing protein [Actinomycetota bacterium]|nr:DUF58 domain-containing protein [Actinomycetota bacterium]
MTATTQRSTGRRRAGPGLGALASAAVIAALGAVIGGRPELAGLAAVVTAPLLVSLLSSDGPRDLAVRLSFDSDRCTEGERVTAAVDVEADAPWSSAEVVLRAPRGFAAGPAVRSLVELRPGTSDPDHGPGGDGDGAPGGDGDGGPGRYPAAPIEVPVGGEPWQPVDPVRASVEVDLWARAWGDHRFDAVDVVLHDRLGLVRLEARTDPAARVRVHPPVSKVQSLLDPRTTRLVVGAHRSRARGRGIELADVRPHVTGDALSTVNWRVTARRGRLHVTDRHPEQASDVVLFLDTFAEAGGATDGTLRLAVTTAMLLAERHLGALDRVGLAELGGVLRWLPMSTGVVQLQRIVDALLDANVIPSGVDKTIDVLPTRAVPDRALVVGLSPLLDPRGMRALVDLRARGRDVVALVCEPEAFLGPATTPIEATARRIWRLERERFEVTLAEAGIASARLPRAGELEPVLSGLLRARRAVRVTRR